MLTAEEIFIALARDAVAIPVSTAFARVALRSRRERLGVVYVQAVLLACLAAVNAQRLATTAPKKCRGARSDRTSHALVSAMSRQ